MANDFLNVYLESNFQYTSASHKFGQDEDSLRQLMEQELLDYKLFFEQGKWLDTEIQHIATELEKTGKLFAKNQGFGEGLRIGTRASGSLQILGTGNLVNGIHAKPENTKNGWTIMFWNDAKNERNQYYAGHMEYGFHDRGGNFVPARPFMRPALYAVAEGSKGNFKNIMQGLLGNIWTGKGFQGVSQLSFGTKSMSPQSNFWSNSKNFTERLGAKTNIGQLRGDKHRQKMSIMRPANPHSVTQKPGYKLAANRSDWNTLHSQSGQKLSKQTRSYKKASGSLRKKSGQASGKARKGNRVSRQGLKYNNREKFNEFHNNLLKQRLDAQRQAAANKVEAARKAREERARLRKQRIMERDKKRTLEREQQSRPGKQGRKQSSKDNFVKVSILSTNHEGERVIETHQIRQSYLNEHYERVTGKVTLTSRDKLSKKYRSRDITIEEDRIVYTKKE